MKRKNIRRTWESIGSILEKIGNVLGYIALSALLLIAVGVLYKTVRVELHRIYLHHFLFLGVALFFALRFIPRVRQNTDWLMKFTHELTHLIFAILFFRKINRFKVDINENYVSYSNGRIGYHLITLAPYCIPIFTLILLPWRFTTGAASDLFLAMIDTMVGFTFAFHLNCWARQIRLSQTDIQGPGVGKSILFIALFQLLHLSLILMLPSSGVLLAVKRTFWLYPAKMLTWLF